MEPKDKYIQKLEELISVYRLSVCRGYESPYTVGLESEIAELKDEMKKAEQKKKNKKTSWRDFTMREPEIPILNYRNNGRRNIENNYSRWSHIRKQWQCRTMVSR